MIDDIIRWFLPKEDKFYDLLEQQGTLLNKVAQVLTEFTNFDGTKLADAVQKIEHEGDDLVSCIETELAKTFVTPIDREDIHELSVQMDDVIDYCNLATRACVMYRMERPTEAMSSQIHILAECNKQISEIIPCLRQHRYEEFFKVKASIKLLETEADRIFRDELSYLFEHENDYKSLAKQKEVLKKLEAAIDCCERITKFLSTLAVKHG